MGKVPIIFGSLIFGFLLFSVFAVIFLLLFGYITLLRLIHRDKTTDEYKDKLAKIRLYFAEKDLEDGIINFMPFNPYKKSRERDWKKTFSFGKGGLTKTVMLLNSVLLFMLTMLFCGLVISQPLPDNSADPVKEIRWLILIIGILSGVGVFLGYWFLQTKAIGKDHASVQENNKIEASFIIERDRPKNVYEQLRELDMIDHYRILKGYREHICDKYHDTKENDLASKECSLRLRTSKNGVLITFKGKISYSDNTLERDELEEPLNKRSIKKINKRLRKLGICSVALSYD